jgi:transposase
MVFVGIDWAEDHHDVCLLDEQGQLLVKGRVSEGLEGVRWLHELVAEHAEAPEQVVVGIEIDRGLLVQTLVAAGYQVYAINPLAVSRYRDRHTTSRAKSDAGDAKLLADLVRTDRHNHRPVAGDSEHAETVEILARAHQNLVWTRKRHTNQLRSLLREFYPAALAAFEGGLAERDAIAVLERAPTPDQGRSVSRAKIVSALRRAGRQRNLETKAAEIQACLRAPQVQPPPLVARAYGRNVIALVRLLRQLNQELVSLEQDLADAFKMHPDAEIYLSQPGLGNVLGARVLGEFGDDRTRFANPKARKNYAGTSPITRASGTKKIVLARYARNRRLGDTLQQWAFCALRGSPGAKAYYRQLRDRRIGHQAALRQLANRLVGILRGCLKTHTSYDEHTAWGHHTTAAA